MLSTELQKTSCMRRSVKPLLVRDHSILTLTRSVVVVQDFTADRVQLHGSHGHSSVFHHISLPKAQKGAGDSPPHTVRGALVGKRADSTGITVSLAPPKAPE